MEQTNLPKDYKRLKIIREEYKKTHSKNLTLDAIAKKAHCNKSTISRCESGTGPLTVDIAKAYADALGVSLEYVCGYSDAKFPANANVSHRLGITDNVASTMKKLQAISTPENNYTAVLNAFIGNGEDTLIFINTILMHMFTEYLSEEKNPLFDTIVVTSIIRYLNDIVKPNLKPIFEDMKAIQENKADNMTYTSEDITAMEQMLSECYEDMYAEKKGQP